MAELTNNQLLLLDNLIYLKGVACEQENKTVADVVNGFLDNHTDTKEGSRDEHLVEAMDVDGDNVAFMSYKDWIQILQIIQSDPDLMKLRIKHSIDEYSSTPEGGMRVACFIDDDNDATVAFNGTGGPLEWHDNGLGVYSSDTQQQIKALDYINQLVDIGYNHITVTGHSKGGNKAQYVALLSEHVDRCVSFEGQGFSREFFDKYQEQIARNAYKITSIADAWDYVNCMLFPVVDTQYIDSGYVHKLSEISHNHCPNSMLDKNGNLHKETEPSILTKIISTYTQYINEHLEGEERKKAVDGIVSVFEGNYKSEGEDLDTALDILKNRADDFIIDQLILMKNDLEVFIDDRKKDFEHMAIDLSVLINKRAAKDAKYIENFKSDISILFEDLMDNPTDIKEISSETAQFIIHRAMKDTDYIVNLVEDLADYLDNSVPDAITVAHKVTDYIKEKVSEGMDISKDLLIANKYVNEAIYKEIACACEHVGDRAEDLAKDITQFIQEKATEGSDLVVDLGHDIYDFMNHKVDNISGFCSRAVNKLDESIIRHRKLKGQRRIMA